MSTLNKNKKTIKLAKNVRLSVKDLNKLLSQYNVIWAG